MTLRSSRNRDRNRQNQLSMHTAVQHNTELPDNDLQHSDDNNENLQVDADSLEDGKCDAPDTPKRPAVCFSLA